MEYELTRIDESHFNLLLAPSCRDKKWPRAVMELAGRSWRTRMQTLTPSLPENRQLTNHYFVDTRSYAALRAADLDWIVGQGYSLGGYIMGNNNEKPTWNLKKP